MKRDYRMAFTSERGINPIPAVGGGSFVWGLGIRQRKNEGAPRRKKEKVREDGRPEKAPALGVGETATAERVGGAASSWREPRYLKRGGKLRAGHLGHHKSLGNG